LSTLYVSVHLMPTITIRLSDAAVNLRGQRRGGPPDIAGPDASGRHGTPTARRPWHRLDTVSRYLWS
jgi:hypothetical protein